MSGFENRFQCYSSSQLQELLEDDDKLRRIVGEMEEMQEMQQNKELTIASNRSLAEQNLGLQPDLDHQKIQLTKRYCYLQEQHEAYQLRRSTLGSSSLDTLLALLQTEGAKIEEETENMADSFLDGVLPLDGFIDDFQNKRKLAHLRRVKIDKLRDMVLRGLHLPQVSSNGQQTSSSSSQLLANGSPAHLTQTTASHPSVQTPMSYPDIRNTYFPQTAVPSYSSPYPHGPHEPGGGLPPQAGFILQ